LPPKAERGRIVGRARHYHPKENAMTDNQPRYTTKRMQDEIATARAYGAELAAQFVQNFSCNTGEYLPRKDLVDGICALGAPAPSHNVVGADRLIEAAKDVIVSASDTYKKRNGHLGSFEDDSGEKCWIVPFDAFEGLRSAVDALASTKVGR
jgi:hypothetical protein